MKHFGGGPVGRPNIGKPMNVAPAISKPIDLTGKGLALHGKMPGKSAGSHGGNVKAGKYHKPFGG